MCNPMEQLISKVYVCFLFQHTQKNAKIVKKKMFPQRLKQKFVQENNFLLFLKNIC